MKNANQHIGGNPTGRIGILLGHLMNFIHAGMYRKEIQNLRRWVRQDDEKISILDAGCGGGKAVQLFCEHLGPCRVAGIDHSDEMVSLSKRTCRKAIRTGRAEIVKGDVEEIPYPSSSFDLVSAFDTINTWNGVDRAISEIRRVLKPDGLFVILNGYPKPGSKWYDRVRFKSDAEYRSFLEGNGFGILRMEVRKNTVAVISRKGRVSS